MLHTLLLLFAISMDSFAAGLSYSASKIKIPKVSLFIISIVGTVFFSVSLLLSEVIKPLVSVGTLSTIGVSLLLTLGVNSIFQVSIKSILRKAGGFKRLGFSFGGINIASMIYLDETACDLDNSKRLSPKEAFLLASALSIDSLVSGFGVGADISNKLLAIVLSFILGFVAISLGTLLGGRLSGKINCD